MNLLRTDGFTAIANVDYDTFKEWDFHFNEKFDKMPNLGPGAGMTDEEIFNYGASIMLKDVIAMIENPPTETVDAFKALTAPSINGWYVAAAVVGVGAGMLMMPKILWYLSGGKNSGSKRSWTWKTLI